MLRTLYLFSALFLSCLILFVSLKEEIDIGPDLFTFSDKIFHFGAYLVLTFLWCRYFLIKKSNVPLNQVLLQVGLGMLVYGIIIEVLQTVFTENRSGEFADIVANVLGIVVAIFVIKLFVARKLNTNKGLFF